MEIIKIRSSVGKGKGLFASRNIKKGDYIALYRVEARPMDEVDNVYGVVIPTLDDDSFDHEFTGVPIIDDELYIIIDGVKIKNIARYVNEPSPNETSNAELLLNRAGNLIRQNKRRASLGDIFDFYLYATRNIRAGQEILWYYGSEYKRNYPVGH